MKPRQLWITNVIAALAVLVWTVAVRRRWMPLGVPGEWEWQRTAMDPNAIDLVLALFAVLLYSLFAAVGYRSLGRRATRWRELGWVAALGMASIGIQGAAQSGAPVGYGLAKWVIALSQEGSSGYFTVAKTQAQDLPRFLAEYPEWIRQQDALHIGTHPPGLIVVQAVILRGFTSAPWASRLVFDHAPYSVTQAQRYFGATNPMNEADWATLIATGFLTLLACAWTVWPMYLFARASLKPRAAWAAAALWPLVPSAIMFQPIADAAFPLLSTTSFALAAWLPALGHRRRLAAASTLGILLGIGMQLTLAFLAVGFVVALILVTDSREEWRLRYRLILEVGVGFAATTAFLWWLSGANPFAIWWANQKNHARFYVEFPRTYFTWILVNGVELAIALGLPLTTWSLAAPIRRARVSRVTLVTFGTLVLLTISGRNLSEIPRLWLPFFPALCVGSGSSLDESEAGPWTVALSVTLLGVQTLATQAMIQVVYPI